MTKISDLTALTGAGVDSTSDLLPIVDMSAAGSARNKKITVDEARIGLGLGTAASPQFTGINLGHASDTTITRASAGVVAIEGVNIVTTAGGVTFAADIIVPDEAYDATAWNGSLEVPTKNAVRDKIESLSGGVTTLDGLTDVNAPTPSNGDVLTWDSTPGEWVSAAPTGGSFTAASTTEVLTGTDSSKGVTSDSLAALWEQGSDVASSGTISLGEGGYFNITGTTTITDIDFGTDKAGRHVWVKFAGALTLTHNSSTLILPTGANITTAADDTACFISEGSDAVRCVAYQRKSGAALAGSSGGGLEYIGTYTPSAVASFDIENFAGLTSYGKILIEIEGITVSADSIGLTMRYKLGGSYQTGSNYKYAVFRNFTTSPSDYGTTGATSIELSLAGAGGIGAAAGEHFSGTISLNDPYNTSNYKHCIWDVGWIDDQATPRQVNARGAAHFNGTSATAALEGVRIIASSGTLSGTVRVYGYKNS